MKITQKTLAEVFRHSVSAFKDQIWARTYDSQTIYTYESFGHRCHMLSNEMLQYGVAAGDKVAIYSIGLPNWSLAFFCATAFGRVAVPILPDFSGSEAGHVLEHSEAKVLFASKLQLAKLSEEVLSKLVLVYEIESMTLIRNNAKEMFAPVDVAEPKESDLAAIIYTSGTTGQAKGVMLSHQNFIANLHAGIHFYPLGKKDVLLSILPLAHAYELSLGMLYPFICGASVVYLCKAPNPSFLMNVMQEVRPTAMLTVPLIIEKVYKGTIVPMVKKSSVLSWMDKHMNRVLCRLIGKRMIKTFGGRMSFFGIGGAKLDIDVERFLQKARFPYYIGYGLTECAPLLALCTYKDTVPGQIGRAVHGVTLKLDNINPETGEGEIVAKGPNIMPGYYKDEARTADAFNDEGWFRTKDVASVDSKGRYAIKGRIGNMILGSSGENIYPEEIEKVVKEIPMVEDVIVICRNHKLVALVRAADKLVDMKKAETDEQSRAAVAGFKKTIKDYVNARVNQSSKIHDVQVMKEPFEKTATMKIRRFKYKDDAPTI